VNNANYAWIQHSIHHLLPVGVAGFVMAKTTERAHSRSMKITEDGRKYATEQGSAEAETLKKGMEEKSREFTAQGSEICAKA
jgi:type I restriction-modification system DNA methylase subunit